MASGRVERLRRTKHSQKWRLGLFFLSFFLFHSDGRRREKRKVYSSAVDKVMENCASEKRLDGAADGGPAVPIP